MKKKSCALVFFFCSVFYFAGYAQEKVFNINDISLDSLLNIKISSASKYLETTTDAPSSVSIITAEDIEKYGYKTFAELLGSVRGTYQRYDRNYTYFGVRGFSRPADFNDRILLTINGHSLNEFFYGQALLGTDMTLPIESIDRVEIIRGPGSVIYGNNAMFAVINIVTKTGGLYDRRNVFVELGDAHRKRIGFFARQEFDYDFNGFIAASFGDVRGRDIYFPEFDSSHNNYGVAQNLDWDRFFGVYGNITYKSFNIQGLFGSREKGIPTAGFNSIFNDPRFKTTDTRDFIEVKYASDICTNKNVSLRAYYDHYFYEGFYPYDQLERDLNHTHWVGAEGLFVWDYAPSSRLIFGAEYKNYFKSSFSVAFDGIESFNNNTPSHTTSVYAQNEFQVTNSLLLNLGLRYDKQYNQAWVLAPRLALVYTPTDETTFKYIYGEAFRYPNMYESYYVDSLNRFTLVNNLNEEMIRSNEIIVEQKFTNELFGIISFYTNRVSDLLETRGSSFIFENIGKINTTGIEFECNAIMTSGLSCYLRYSYQKSKNMETDEALTNSPEHLLKLGGSIPFLRYFRCSAEILYESGRITLAGTETDPVFIVNANLHSKLITNRLNVSLYVTNLLNKSYSYPAGYEHRPNLLAQDPRTFNLKLSYDL